VRVAERSRSKAQAYKSACYEIPELAQAKYYDLFSKKTRVTFKPTEYKQLFFYAFIYTIINQ